MAQRFHWDLALACLFVVLILDLQARWNDRLTCPKPTYFWLLGFYANTFVSRVALIVSTSLSSLKATLACITMQLILVLPLNVVWTVFGFIWQLGNMSEAPECKPPTKVPWLMYYWLGTSVCIDLFLIFSLYYLVAFYRARRRIEALLVDINEIMMNRYFNELTEMLQGSNDSEENGLTEIEMSRIETFRYSPSAYPELFIQQNVCAVCTEAFKKDELLFKLPICGHIYHQSCIKHWLVSKPVCPLCRGDVRSNLYSATEEP